MKIENQVCSLKLSKKLKKLGVKQESVWCWTRLGGKIHGNTKHIDKLFFLKRKKLLSYKNEDFYSAFTVAELGEKLPDYIKDFGNLDIGKNHTDHVTMKKKLAKHRTWHISYWTWGDFHTPKHKDLYFKQISNPEIPLIHAKTEANARAKCLIYLIENKLIKKE